MISRLLKLNTRNSILLLGPRGTGKSSLIHSSFRKKNTLWIDLIQPEQEENFSRQPGLLRELIQAQKPKVVIIGEVQKVPELLDIAHELIEARGLQFVLTGSSARKLKRGSANLLVGRAFGYHLDPFTHLELGARFSLKDALEFGMLPKIYFPFLHKPKERWSNTEKIHYLQTYARTYLKEEILLEQHVRKIKPFRNFLETAAQMNGKIIEYAKISTDVGVDDKTIAEYFQILEDTLIGFLLEPYHRSIRKRQGAKPKFYFFDPGVKRALDRTLTVPLLSQTAAFGEAFEHFLILEFKKIANTLNPDIRFTFFRTSDGTQEIDLIVERPGRAVALVEIKSSEHVSNQQAEKLLVFKKNFDQPKLYVLCREKMARQHCGVYILPWQLGLTEILQSPNSQRAPSQPTSIRKM